MVSEITKDIVLKIRDPTTSMQFRINLKVPVDTIFLRLVNQIIQVFSNMNFDNIQATNVDVFRLD